MFCRNGDRGFKAHIPNVAVAVTTECKGLNTLTTIISHHQQLQLSFRDTRKIFRVIYFLWFEMMPIMNTNRDEGISLCDKLYLQKNKRQHLIRNKKFEKH